MIHYVNSENMERVLREVLSKHKYSPLLSSYASKPLDMSKYQQKITLPHNYLQIIDDMRNDRT